MWLKATKPNSRSNIPKTWRLIKPADFSYLIDMASFRDPLAAQTKEPMSASNYNESTRRKVTKTPSPRRNSRIAQNLAIKKVSTQLDTKQEVACICRYLHLMMYTVQPARKFIFTL
jgi:hypothetical protein